MNIDNILNIGGLTLVALMILLFILDFVKYITDYKFTVELINSAIVGFYKKDKNENI